eukprot:6478982-Amphidinium_carterae.1
MSSCLAVCSVAKYVAMRNDGHVKKGQRVQWVHHLRRFIQVRTPTNKNIKQQNTSPIPQVMR